MGKHYLIVSEFTGVMICDQTALEIHREPTDLIFELAQVSDEPQTVVLQKFVAMNNGDYCNKVKVDTYKLGFAEIERALDIAQTNCTDADHLALNQICASLHDLIKA